MVPFEAISYQVLGLKSVRPTLFLSRNVLVIPPPVHMKHLHEFWSPINVISYLLNHGFWGVLRDLGEGIFTTYCLFNHIVRILGLYNIWFNCL